MGSENRFCQNCKQNFVIEPEDFKFYEKISVPPPTFCPKCRLQRRLAFFNIFNLYERECDLCKKKTISTHPKDSPYIVYCPPCWWSDNWDPLDYGRDYDFSKPFFEQFDKFWREVPILGLSLDLPTLKTSPWNNHAGNLKNCYMIFHGDFNENSAYGFYLNKNHSLLDTTAAIQTELLYDSMHCYKTSRGAGLRNQVVNSLDCLFVRYAFNCQNCFASANIRNKKYLIFNNPYAREEYFEEIKRYDLGSHKTYKEVKKLAEEHWKKFPPKPHQDDMSVGSTGSHIFQSKNCKESLEVVGAEDSKYLWLMSTSPIKDCYDISSWGNNIALSYDCCTVGETGSGLKFCQETGINLYNAEYCKLSTGGSNHFGCVSIKKGEYVIFNKKYSEKDFYEFRQRIVAHMQKMPYRDVNSIEYKYGEFFPPELSSFAYNETLARYFFPLSKEEALNKRYRWRDHEIPEQEITKSTDDVPDHIKDAPDSIVEEVIGCKTCGRGFRIIPMELAFLRRLNVPIPRECPFCRIDEKVQKWVKQL